MASIISAGTTSGTALNLTGDTSGNLAFTTGAGAYTISVPNVTGTLLTNKTAGTVLQVVQASTNTTTTINTNTYTDTSLSASITPTSTSNKILVLVSQTYTSNNSAANGGGIRILRGSTSIFDPSPIDSSGAYLAYFSLSSSFWGVFSINYLDSPNTTSSTTYKTQGRPYIASNGSLILQPSGNVQNGTSTITLIEIAA